METSICIREIIRVLDTAKAQSDLPRKKNVIAANMWQKPFGGIVWYLLGKPPPGFDTAKISIPVFYIAEPKKLSDWDELMEYFKNHPKGGDDNILAAQFFIREQPKDERQLWRSILSKSYRLEDEKYLSKELKEKKNGGR